MKALSTIITSLLLVTSAAQASIMEQFIDPKDGAFDASNWLIDNAVGFLPVPFIITEPAVGTGLGMSALFFHPNEKFKTEVENDVDAVAKLPPSISGVIGFGTDNGTWGTGAFHLGIWREDTVRYLGALFYANVNLKYYKQGLDNIGGNGINYSLGGTYLLQELKFRVNDSNLFIGGKYTFFDSTSEFNINTDLPYEIPSRQFDLQDAAAHLLVEYDSRDNVFTPESGFNFKYSYALHDTALGGDRDYSIQSSSAQAFTKVADDWMFAVRAAGETSDGDVPYFAAPSLMMRGLAAMRYQGEHTLSTEVEVRYDFTSRWSGLVFGGVGKAIQKNESLSDASSQVTKGLGFRYLIARRFNFRTGLDVAWGPDESAIYVTAGYAWALD